MHRFYRNVRSLEVVGARTRSAFTLLELFVVAGLLASLAAVSWPALRRSFDKTEHRRVVDDVRLLLNEARSRALARRRPQLVRVEPDQTEIALYEVAFDEADAARFDESPSKSDAPRAAMASSRESDPHHLDAAPEVAESGEEIASGSELTLVQSLPLPAHYHCRAASGDALRRSAEQRRSSSERVSRHAMPGDAVGQPRSLGAEIDAQSKGFASDASTDSTTNAGPTAPAPHVLFDVAGHTADALWEIAGPGGYCTPLTVVGALGKLQVGETQGRRAGEREPADSEADRETDPGADPRRPAPRSLSIRPANGSPVRDSEVDPRESFP